MSPQVGDHEQVTLTKARRYWHPLHLVSPPSPKEKAQEDRCGCNPTSDSKAPGSHQGSNTGQIRGSKSTGQGSLAILSTNPRFLYHRTVAGVSAGRLDPRPIPKLEDVLLCPVAGGLGGRSMGSRGTARKFRDAARSSGTLAASPWGVCSLHPHLQHAMGTRTPAPAPGVEGQTRAEGRKGARGSAGSRGRPMPLTCAAGGSCRQRRRGR